MRACRGCWRPVRTFQACTQAASADRVALEAYPGLLARELIGRRSYKSDDLQKQTPERHAARADLLAALEAGQTRLGLRLSVTKPQRAELLARCPRRRCRRSAVPPAGGLGPAARRAAPVRATACRESVDPLEGWIVTA